MHSNTVCSAFKDNHLPLLLGLCTFIYAVCQDQGTAEAGSISVSQLAFGLKPRYHFSGIEGKFYERQPYRYNALYQSFYKRQAFRYNSSIN